MFRTQEIMQMAFEAFDLLEIREMPGDSEHVSSDSVGINPFVRHLRQARLDVITISGIR